MMNAIKKKYIVDEQNRRIAVQIDVETFEQIEEVLENHALFHLMQEDNQEEALDLIDARTFYEALPKTT